jgi:hypothetical protein
MKRENIRKSQLFVIFPLAHGLLSNRHPSDRCNR